MRTRVAVFALAGMAGAGAFVSLYGATRSGAIEHEDWAVLLLQALDLDRGLPEEATPSQAFSVLSWKSSLAFAAEDYLRAAGVEAVGPQDERRLVAGAQAGEVVYPLSVLRGGDYRVRVRVAGAPSATVTTEIHRLQDPAPVAEFAVAPAEAAGWVDAGVAHLDPGAYGAAVVLPTGASLSHLEVAPPCLSPVEPQGGWREGQDMLEADLAVTMVQALDAESELPPAAMPIEHAASAFRVTAPVAMAASSGDGSSEIRAGALGLRAVVFVDVPEEGLYTLSAFGIVGGGQSWVGDSCRKSVVCPADEIMGPEWQAIMTTRLTAGRHSFAVALGAGASVSRLRLERKKETAADYAATLSSFGFAVQPLEAPVSAAHAQEAVGFLEKRWAEEPQAWCGDLVLPSGDTLAAPPPLVAMPTTPAFSGTGPAPLNPPEVPLQLPASPVIPLGGEPGV